MSRGTTSNLALGVWDDGDNPGAGSKSVASTGLNGNMITLDTAVGTEHNANGTHKAAVIDGTNLKSTAVDGSTIVQDGTTKKLGVKALGITSAQIAAGAVIAGKILGTGAGKAVDGSTIDLNVSNELEIKPGSVGATQLDHDNTQIKHIFSFAFDAITLATYAKVHGLATTSTLGIPMPRAGSFTRAQICLSDGTSSGYDVAYDSASYKFAQGDRINAKIVSRGGGAYNGIEVRNLTKAEDWLSGFETYGDITGMTAAIVLVEVEFD